jgi:lipoprotein-anchoring transpeptidase ErfK/SrfK
VKRARSRWPVVAGFVAIAAAVAALAYSFITPRLPGEGGRGYAVAAVAGTEVASTTTAPAQVRTAPAWSRPEVQPGSVAVPSYIATLGAPTPYSARAGGATIGNLAATNPFGTPEVLAVLGEPGSSGWLHVELPVRPNGSTGWIRSSGVSITETFYRVEVSLTARTVTVFDAGRTVLTTRAAVGAPNTPTPPGDTYLWELVRPDDPDGAYGPYIFGLGWFSDAYSVFNGGDAQIGIHGNDEPWSIGYAESHGCVRVPNGVITDLAGLLPLGTPVTIS